MKCYRTCQKVDRNLDCSRSYLQGPELYVRGKIPVEKYPTLFKEKKKKENEKRKVRMLHLLRGGSVNEQSTSVATGRQCACRVVQEHTVAGGRIFQSFL